jgi:hypothetical protein
MMTKPCLVPRILVTAGGALALCAIAIADSGARPGGGGMRGGGGFHGGGGGAHMASSNIQRPGGGGAGTRFNGNGNFNRNTNYNRNTNVNVNRNVNVDVDNHWDHGCCGHDGWGTYHPVAAGIAVGAAVGTAAAVTAAAIGSVAYALPPACVTQVYPAGTYYSCDGVWYQPQYAGTQVTYVVVNNPS